MSINLRQYQLEAIEAMFGSEDGSKEGLYDKYRYAAVFLPTGGGKSFVGMESMNRIMTREDSGDVISNTPMLYLSPNEGIIYQYQLHMAEHLIFEHHLENMDEVTRENIADRVEEVLQRFSSSTSVNREEVEDYIDKHPDMDTETLLRKALKSQLGKQPVRAVDAGVKKAFPNLQFKCYQSMRSKSVKTDEVEENLESNDALRTFYVEDIPADFVIFDEAHRGGAKEWKTRIDKLVASHKSTKFLTITATPERDGDDQSIMDSIASKTGYSTEDRREKKYVAKDYKLIQAMEDGKVVTPDVVYFPCTLDQTKEYREVRKAFEEAREKSRKNPRSQSASDTLQVYREILDRMHKLMGRPDNMSDAEWETKKQEMIAEIIRESGLNEHGKYISFIPKTPSTTETIDLAQRARAHVGSYEERIKGYLGQALGIGASEVYAKGYHSSAYTAKENQDTLQEFVGFETDSGPAKVIITCQKLNEGVHVDSTEGLFMFEEITSENRKTIKDDPKIRFLQQIGRCITSIDEEHPERTVVPKIFDFGHNFMRQSELLLTDAGEQYFTVPKQERDFYKLYKIFKEKPVRVGYRSPDGMSFDEARKKGKEILVFNYKDKHTIDFPGKEEPEPVKREISKATTRKNMQTPEGELKILDVSRLEIKKRYSNLTEILDVLSQNGINTSSLDETATLSTEFLQANGLKGAELSKALNELFEANRNVVRDMDKTPYPIGQEMKLFRNAFFGISSGKAIPKDIFGKESIDIPRLVRMGILHIDLTNIPEELKDRIDSRGFIIPNEKMAEEFFGINIQTGTRYFEGRDEFGCDETGYDIYGYDKYGFNKDGIHKITGTKYDERFFFKSVEKDPKTGEEITVWKNIQTNTSVDRLGYNHDGINPDTGFDRGRIENGVRVHYWHKPNPDGTFSRRGSKRDENKINFYGFDGKSRIGMPSMGPVRGSIGAKVDFYNFDNTRRSHQTGEYRDLNGRDIERFDERGFNEVGIHRDTSYEYGLDARNAEGKLHPDVKLCQDIVKLLLTKKMTPEQVCSELKLPQATIADSLERALTVYGMSPELKDDMLSSQVTQNKSAIETLAKLSPAMHKQFVERTRYKVAVVRELEARKAQYRAQGEKGEKKLQELTAKINQIKASTIVKRQTEDELEL